MIKQKYRISKKFWVQLVSKYEVKKMIKDLKNNKSVGVGGGGGGGREIPIILTEYENKSFMSVELPGWSS